jgi:hypothetical protein
MKAKIRLLWFVTGLAVVTAIALITLWMTASNFWSPEANPLKEVSLPRGEIISLQTYTTDFGVGTGDVFPYSIEVWYDTLKVSEIDKANLEQSVNLKPFDIRSTEKTEYDLTPAVRVYRIEYELQAIDTIVGTTYEFPAIFLQYKTFQSTQIVEAKLIPQTVYVTSQLPSDVSDLEVHLPAGTVEDPSRKYPGRFGRACRHLRAFLEAPSVFWNKTEPCRE